MRTYPLCPILLPLLAFLCISAHPRKTLVAAEVQTLLLDPVDESRERPVPLRVYHVPSKKPQPVILFSHGLGGSRDNNAYLGNHWASHGYIAVFMQHHGSDAEVWKSAAPAQRMSALKKAASAQSSIDRFSDVPFVLDQLEKWNAAENHPLQGKLDLDHIGLTGHSFGAVTTLGLTGRKFPLNRSFGDDRIDAFLPMSPSPGKGISAERAFSHLEVPILCMTGTEDGSPIDPTTSPESRLEVYAALPAGDKYQLVFKGGEHHAFGDSPGGALRKKKRFPHHHPAIQKISTEFWDAYLRDDDKAKAWLQSKAPRRACSLDPEDVWEWK